jgi:hypothetical protein
MGSSAPTQDVSLIINNNYYCGSSTVANANLTEAGNSHSAQIQHHSKREAPRKHAVSQNTLVFGREELASGNSSTLNNRRVQCSNKKALAHKRFSDLSKCKLIILKL